MPPPDKTSSLSFVWRRDFVYGKPGLCFKACAVMACKYWDRYHPEFELPLSFEDLADSAGASYFSNTGLSVEALRKAFQKESIQELDGERIKMGLDAEIKTLESINDLYPFLEQDPPFFVVMAFDKSFSEKGIPSDSHAVVLHSIDYKAQKIYVIDPVKGNLNAPYPYDFSIFSRGWERCDNLIFIFAPLGILKLISGDKVKVIKQTTLGDD